MSNVIAWIAAQAEPPEIAAAGGTPWLRSKRRGDVSPQEQLRPRRLPTHQFPATGEEGRAAATSPLPAKDAGNGAPGAERTGSETQIDWQPTLAGLQDQDQERERRIYRGRTVTMLRRYMRYSIETGRLPSLLGKEFFRAKVTAYTVVTFEDRVIFVHDMEKCLERLDEFSRQLIARHVLQEHDRWATAKLLHCNEKTVRRLTPLALDLLSEILLDVGLLERLDSNSKNSCQGGQDTENSVSDCEDGKNKF